MEVTALNIDMCDGMNTVERQAQGQSSTGRQQLNSGSPIHLRECYTCTYGLKSQVHAWMRDHCTERPGSKGNNHSPIRHHRFEHDINRNHTYHHANLM